MHDLDEFAGVADQQDRSATFELIRNLTSPNTGALERDRIADALGELGDPRAVLPLTRIGYDRDQPDEIRQTALSVLERSSMHRDSAVLRAWWNSGDDLVRAYVLRQATRDESDLVESVACDPHHLLHRHALEGIVAGFEEPHWQQYKIVGLNHPDPAIRSTAADVLYWDEPVAAEPALQRASADVDTDVACSAIETLRYYPSRSTLRLLHEISQGDDASAASARDVVADMLGEFENEQARIRHWLAPVAALLGTPDSDAVSSLVPPGSPGSPLPKQSVPKAAEVLAAYSDLDGQWAPKLAALGSYDWSGVPAADRPGLATFLSSHPDPKVRQLCCQVLSSWHQTDSLLALARDLDPGVRGSAVYSLRFVPPSVEIATFTWDLVVSGRVAGTRGAEALAACAAHTRPGELEDRLIMLARTDLREKIRLEAVSLLGDRIKPLLPLLSEPPLLTWAVHIQLLSACRSTDVLPRTAAALRNVDNLHLAATLADLAD
ncbi:hypothetical protein ACFVUS_25615 [Nocardia sp. NPDC058058]|uniref:hypothetical protein n=1 Tax=Nocardia sp. NPDC058058 TaxID=3346317 RepID=UPI0036D9E7E2